MRPIHYCSLFPLFIETITINKKTKDQIVLSQATGCLYQDEDSTYLITNWHVLSGRHSHSRDILHSQGGLPEIIKAYFPLETNPTTQKAIEFSLKSENEEYLWLEHPSSNAVDVGALKICLPDGIATKPINNIAFKKGVSSEDWFFVTQDVWVIGYPKGIRVEGLPIWKSATIASEPIVSSKANNHKLILDTATREGMSGSPVLFVNKSLSRVQFDGTSHEVDCPSVKVLLGIYSGRVAGNDELSAQLGIAWMCDCIPEIIAGKQIYKEK
jgi:hypothetical protein